MHNRYLYWQTFYFLNDFNCDMSMCLSTSHSNLNLLWCHKLHFLVHIWSVPVNIL